MGKKWEVMFLEFGISINNEYSLAVEKNIKQILDVVTCTFFLWTFEIAQIKVLKYFTQRLFLFKYDYFRFESWKLVSFNMWTNITYL